MYSTLVRLRERWGQLQVTTELPLDSRQEPGHVDMEIVARVDGGDAHAAVDRAGEEGWGRK